MDNKEIEDAIKDAVTSCTGETGWANLAELGGLLRKKEIKYGKLSNFLKKYQYLIETKVDTEIQPPVAYARLKPES